MWGTNVFVKDHRRGLGLGFLVDCKSYHMHLDQFLFVKLKQLPLWPPRDVVRANMPHQFKAKYIKTQVILDATEIYIEQPHLPELQQMTFSNYKNEQYLQGSNLIVS